MASWKLEKIADIIEDSIRTYLAETTTKGCIFWDKKTFLCKCHTVRPFNCRIYSITPEEEFQPRIDKFREMYKNDITAIILDQCNLCSIVNHSKLTVNDTDNWWNKIVMVERSLGIKPELINDNPGGTYRMFHDHVLLHTCPDSIMSELSRLRQLGTPEEKEIAIINFMKIFRDKIQQHLNPKGQQNDQGKS